MTTHHQLSRRVLPCALTTDVLKNGSNCARSSLVAHPRLDGISTPDFSVGQFEIGDIKAALCPIATCARGSYPTAQPIELERSELVTVDLKLVTADVHPLSSANTGLIRLESPDHQGSVGIY